MDESIKLCISSRCDMFGKYYVVPAAAESDVNAFIADLEALGEQAADSVDFEAKFAAGGYQERFNALIIRCTPQAYQMTKEEKAAARETAKEIFKEDKDRILKEAAAEALDTASVMAEGELIALQRKARIEAGVDDEYTRATNAVDMAMDLGGFIGGLFKKKKDKNKN